MDKKNEIIKYDVGRGVAKQPEYAEYEIIEPMRIGDILKTAIQITGEIGIEIGRGLKWLLKNNQKPTPKIKTEAQRKEPNFSKVEQSTPTKVTIITQTIIIEYGSI